MSAPPGETIVRTLAAMGTELSIEVRATDRPAALQASELVYRAIRDTEARLSTWRDDSELSRLNAGEKPTAGFPSARTLDEIEQAFRWAQATEGAFHPGAGRLVDLYDLRGPGHWPTDEELAELESHLVLLRETLELNPGLSFESGIRLEEGAFAKGAALDAALEALDNQPGVHSALIDFGGELARFGEALEQPVPVSAANDRERVALEVASRAPHVAVTSNVVRGREVDGREVGHVVDPRLGRPVDSPFSVTVFAESGLAADALSTALFVLGPDAGLPLVESLPNVEALFLPPVESALRASAGLTPEAILGLR